MVCCVPSVAYVRRDIPASVGAAADAAQAYVEIVRAADMDRLLALFHPEAVVRNQLGTYEGHDQIAGFYRDVVFAGKAQPEIVRLMEVGDAAMAELAATSPLGRPDQVAYAVDIFHVDDAGLVTKLDIFFR